MPILLKSGFLTQLKMYVHTCVYMSLCTVCTMVCVVYLQESAVAKHFVALSTNEVRLIVIAGAFCIIYSALTIYMHILLNTICD